MAEGILCYIRYMQFVPNSPAIGLDNRVSSTPSSPHQLKYWMNLQAKLFPTSSSMRAIRMSYTWWGSIPSQYNMKLGYKCGLECIAVCCYKSHLFFTVPSILWTVSSVWLCKCWCRFACLPSFKPYWPFRFLYFLVGQANPSNAVVPVNATAPRDENTELLTQLPMSVTVFHGTEVKPRSHLLVRNEASVWHPFYPRPADSRQVGKSINGVSRPWPTRPNATALFTWGLSDNIFEWASLISKSTNIICLEFYSFGCSI